MTTDRCGTTGGYRDHVENGTPKCAPCRAANAASKQDYRRRRYLNRGPFTLDATGTRRRVQALAAIGWSSRDLAARLGITPQTLRKLHDQEHIWMPTRDKVAALYDELSMTPGGNKRSVTWARKRGWAPPLSWSDDPGPACIDDPAARPQHNARGHDIGQPRDLDREEQVMSLTRAGLSAKEIALRLRMHQRQVVRIRTRYRTEGAA